MPLVHVDLVVARSGKVLGGRVALPGRRGAGAYAARAAPASPADVVQPVAPQGVVPEPSGPGVAAGTEQLAEESVDAACLLSLYSQGLLGRAPRGTQVDGAWLRRKLYTVKAREEYRTLVNEEQLRSRFVQVELSNLIRGVTQKGKKAVPRSLAELRVAYGVAPEVAMEPLSGKMVPEVTGVTEVTLVTEVTEVLVRLGSS